MSRPIAERLIRPVTVETGYSWTDRIAIDKVLEVRT